MKWEPEEYARALLKHFQMDRVIDIREFGKAIGLKIREVDSSSFDGALIRIPNQLKGIVGVNSSIREPGRKIFTIAHEIAHYLLPGHTTSKFSCTASDITSWRVSVAKEKELAANRFAAEIILPVRQIYDLVNRRKATIELAGEISNEFGTSLTATVIKCVEATEEACAVVWSTDNQVRWIRRNPRFSYFINAGRLGIDSLAGQLFQPSATRHLTGDMQAATWMETEDLVGKTIWEDSIFLPYYNSVLTILTIDQ